MNDEAPAITEEIARARDIADRLRDATYDDNDLMEAANFLDMIEPNEPRTDGLDWLMFGVASLVGIPLFLLIVYFTVMLSGSIAVEWQKLVG